NPTDAFADHAGALLRESRSRRPSLPPRPRYPRPHMPTYRPDLAAIAPYEPGLPVAEVARRHGLDPDSIIKLASNESPSGPLPDAIEAMQQALRTTNRYPDNEGYDLRSAL